MARIGALLVLASFAAGCAAPAPTPFDAHTSSPAATASPVASAPAISVSTEPGSVMVACEAPIVPGHCLQPVAWAIQHLPPEYAPVASVALMTMNLCPDASPCIGPPHRGERWVAFTLRDGSRVGMRVVEIMAIAQVESVAANATPPSSAEPATGEFPLTCGDIPVATCAGAAGGATDISPNKPLQSVRVQPGTPQHFIVTLSFDDGTHVTGEVAPDSTRDIGWSAVGSPAPP